MRTPHPDGRTIAILLAIALALAVVGLVLKGIAYLLVLVAVGLAAYLVVSRWAGRDDVTS